MIKNVYVRNYKSLGEVQTDLNPVTVLIGRSGTGKSNFVESLRFLRDYLLQRGENSVSQRYGGWPQLLSATAPKPVSLYFTVIFDAPGISGDFQFDLGFQQYPQNPGVVGLFEEKLSLGTRVFFHHARQKWIVPPPLANAPVAGSTAPGSLVLGALTGIQEVTMAYLVLTRGIGCYTFPDDVLLRQGQAMSVAAPQAGQYSSPQHNGLWDHGENFIQAFGAIQGDFQAWQNWKEILAALKRLDPSIRAVDLQMPSSDRITVSHDVGGKALILDLTQESEGIRRFLAHLIALYQTPAKQTLLFEEPEKGIHPGALAVLADQFKTCPQAGRGQVILTTHSPELLDHFEPETLRVVDIENYQTRIGPVEKEQVEAIREQLLRPGELLTVDTARLAASAAV